MPEQQIFQACSLSLSFRRSLIRLDTNHSVPESRNGDPDSSSREIGSHVDHQSAKRTFL